MQNFISFVNERLSWEEINPYCHDCHDPPHAARAALHDDRSPPRRLAGVARSVRWKTTLAQVGFPGGSNSKAKIALGRGVRHFVSCFLQGRE